MKKGLLIAVLFAAIAGSLFAQRGSGYTKPPRIALIQATYLHTSRITDTGINEIKDKFGEFGINVTSFMGQDIGFYSSATFLLPVSMKTTVNGAPTGNDFSYYDRIKLGLDMLLGIGYNAQISPSFSILAAGGVHFNGIALLSKSFTYSEYLKYNLGPGVAVNGIYHLNDFFNVNVSGMLAWDVWEFVTMPDTSATVKGGLTWAVSAGIGFKY